MKNIRWGIAGPGNIAHKFAKALQNVSGATLVAVASRSEEKSKAFAAEYGALYSFGSYEEMANCPEVDAVYVATVHPFHASCATLFLQAKKHVLCEKPLCVNANQAKVLQAVAAQNNVFLMEAMWTRFLPAVQEAVDIVRSGKIGEVLGLSADFCYNLAPDTEPKIYQNAMAGGSLLDVGVYGLHFADLILGSPVSIAATANVSNGVDCHTIATLQYPNGALATVTSAINLHKPESAYIYGTKGRIYVPIFFGAKELYLTVGDQETHIKNPAIGQGFEEEIIEACKCISEGRLQSEGLPLSKTIEILEQMDFIRKQIGLVYPWDNEQ